MPLQNLDIACPDCGKKHTIPARQLETNRKLEVTCACGALLTVDNALPDMIEKIDKMMKNTFDKIGRKL